MQNVDQYTGLSLSIPSLELPIGISFYTFQTISYTVDVYRDQVKVQHSFLRFLMFVSLYPQLVAGPIVRYQDVAAEIDSRTVSARDLSEGMGRFCVGLFKKVFVANIAGELSGPFLSGFDQLYGEGITFQMCCAVLTSELLKLPFHKPEILSVFFFHPGNDLFLF